MEGTQSHFYSQGIADNGQFMESKGIGWVLGIDEGILQVPPLGCSVSGGQLNCLLQFKHHVEEKHGSKDYTSFWGSQKKRRGRSG